MASSSDLEPPPTPQLRGYLHGCPVTPLPSFLSPYRETWSILRRTAKKTAFLNHLAFNPCLLSQGSVTHAPARRIRNLISTFTAGEGGPGVHPVSHAAITSSHSVIASSTKTAESESNCFRFVSSSTKSIHSPAGTAPSRLHLPELPSRDARITKCPAIHPRGFFRCPALPSALPRCPLLLELQQCHGSSSFSAVLLLITRAPLQSACIALGDHLMVITPPSHPVNA